MEKIIQETFPRDIRPRVDVTRDLWPLLGDATQIHQTLLNLCVNARDAMPGGGTLTMRARNVTVDAAFAAMVPEAKPGRFVCVSVADTGTGITPDNMEPIFDPYFTTKEIGKGTGLGLATVLGIVRGHEGFVQVKSVPGRGTTFDLYFPASLETGAAPKGTSDEPSPRGQGELILVVDDEATVRDGLRRTLEVHGYQVVTATHGEEGLAVFDRHRAGLRAILTDMMMPVMGGPAMIHALRLLDSRVPILGMSGLLEQQGGTGFEQVRLSAMLTKPFSGGELVRALRSTLGEPGAIAPNGNS
jgi:CheY-like chemotaxis protein